MDKMMKECMKSHPLLHSLSGIGLGMLILAYFPTLQESAMTLGLVLLVLGIAGEFVFLKK